MELNEITSKIIGAAINVHKELGPGLLESVYNSCLSIELKNCGLEVKTEVPLPVIYKGQKVSEEGFKKSSSAISVSSSEAGVDKP
jgi:GxxExxY protein